MFFAIAIPLYTIFRKPAITVLVYVMHLAFENIARKQKTDTAYVCTVSVCICRCQSRILVRTQA